MIADDDDALAEERTSLAWSRSSLALLACGAAVLKGVPRVAVPRGRPLAGGIIVLIAVAAAAVASWTERARRRAVDAGVGAINDGVVRRVAVANALLGIAAFGLAAFGR